MIYRLFISSVQSEFAEERRFLCDYIMGDVLLGHFFRPFLFEDLPALNDTVQQAELRYEIPITAVTEAIVNAVVHRDYTSNGSVQVMLFRDRLEVWNPGQLPYGLTPAKLLSHHASKPTNPTLAEPVYLAGYIERLGTGTEDMVASCLAAGLPRPDFQQQEDFCVTIWRKNVLSCDENALSLGENAPSCKNVDTVRINGKRLTKKQKSVLEFCKDMLRTSSEIVAYVGVTLYSRTRNTYVTKLVEAGLLRPIVLDKMTSPHQRYVTTAEVLAMCMTQ